ncbi:hypothetical protein HBH56_100880 [Parastagonospora nodorum]|uniref:Uncharacterized protein n=1 Tax=Phaeosphaeria nodorum (strain SN15 / ATCC MYA-4574 / FGSC 10173) TaxID=321614 RepID=A0A7U2ICW6_PHANO|nr:hypothetical protein HBH56_100880 [Parastagonospora nodorum]QRD07557.1 hypothetical protein JI435_424600 [Parastagonospora nodorum SN15]KAH3930196.1 hypothetical protein HBH54_115200 [Parastagonospora nodorum]KAH4080777.1 hypothetical protein HBH46_228510 [Parastagonospora nodorum]KAH4136391.1 hypothetical protein HBH45_135920 [Parastagonospora nodorum]
MRNKILTPKDEDTSTALGLPLIIGVLLFDEPMSSAWLFQLSSAESMTFTATLGAAIIRARCLKTISTVQTQLSQNVEFEGHFRTSLRIDKALIFLKPVYKIAVAL